MPIRPDYSPSDFSSFADSLHQPDAKGKVPAKVHEDPRKEALIRKLLSGYVQPANEQVGRRIMEQYLKNRIDERETRLKKPVRKNKTEKAREIHVPFPARNDHGDLYGPEMLRTRQVPDSLFLQWLSHAGGSVNQLDARGYSCLYTATVFGKKKIVKALLAAHAKPDLVNRGGLTAMDIAAIAGETEILDMMVAAFKASQTPPKNDDDLQLVILTSDWIEELEIQCAQNMKRLDGETASLTSMDSRRDFLFSTIKIINTVEKELRELQPPAILRVEPEPSSANHYNYTFQARMHEDEEFEASDDDSDDDIINLADISDQERQEKIEESNAQMSELTGSLIRIVKQQAPINLPFNARDEQITLLHRAARGNMTTLTGLLLMLGAKIEAQDTTLYLPADSYLNYFREREFTPLHHACASNCPEIIELLLDSGANPNAIENLQERNPAQLLAQANIEQLERLLGKFIKAGLDIDHQRDDGHTLLTSLFEFNTAEAGGGGAGAIRQLVSAGARLDFTPAMQNRYLHNLIQKKPQQADLDLLLPFLLESGCNLESVDDSGFTPLMSACYTRQPLAIRALINAGADVNYKDMNNERILHRAVSTGNLNVVAALLAPRDIGPDDMDDRTESEAIELEVQDLGGNTPLAYALVKDNTMITDLLIDSGASLVRARQDYPSAMHMILDESMLSQAMIRLLVKHDPDWQATDEDGMNALSRMLETGYPDSHKVELLMTMRSCGFDLKTADADGITPLERAIEMGASRSVLAFLTDDLDEVMDNMPLSLKRRLMSDPGEETETETESDTESDED